MNTGKQVNEENRLLNVRITSAEAAVYTPDSLKTPATMYVYKGGTRAVGPDGSG
jgi:hypothetical protein